MRGSLEAREDPAEVPAKEPLEPLLAELPHAADALKSGPAAEEQR